MPLPRLLRRIVGGVLLLVLLVFGGTAVQIWWTARQDSRPVSDVIVVLGASQYDGRPSEVLAARLDHAVELFRAGVAPRVITVGGNQPGDRYTEAGAGKTYLEARGVDSVTAVEEGSDTLESVRAVHREMVAHGWRSAVLVTDPWHALRARRMAADQGIDVASSPTQTGPSVRSKSTEVHYVARETAGYLYYRITGRSTDAGPSAM